MLVASVPSGATVILDFEEVGATPLWLPAVDSGPHSLTLHLPGYAMVDTSITLMPDRFHSIAVTLWPYGGGAPPAPEPSTPPSVEEQPPAPPRVTEAPSPAPATPPAPSPQAEQAAPPTPPATGTLTVVVRPWGTITVDGSIRARETDVRHEEHLPSGHHHVQVPHPTLGSREVTVTIAPGETTRLEFDLNQ